MFGEGAFINYLFPRCENQIPEVSVMIYNLSIRFKVTSMRCCSKITIHICIGCTCIKDPWKSLPDFHVQLFTQNQWHRLIFVLPNVFPVFQIGVDYFQGFSSICADIRPIDNRYTCANIITWICKPQRSCDGIGPTLPYFGKRNQVTKVTFLLLQQNVSVISTDINRISCLTLHIS